MKKFNYIIAGILFLPLVLLAQVQKPGGSNGGATKCSGLSDAQSGCSTAVGTLATKSTAALSDLATQAADTVVMNATASSASPTAVAMPTCTTGADLYNTSTHAWSCVSAGAGGVPWLSITDPTLTTFSWRNQGGASATSRTQSIFLLAPAASGDNIRGREISAPGSTPWSITVGLVPLTTGQNNNQSGLYVSDGTKLVAITLGATGSTNGMSVSKFTNVTTFSVAYAAITMNPPPSPVFLKVVNDGTNLAWYWSPNGLDFVWLDSRLKGDFLSTITAVGVFADSNNATFADGVLLVSWVQGTS